jgi:hypothetical protein
MVAPLQGQQDGATPLPAQSEADAGPQQEQQRGRGWPDLGVGGQQADRGTGQAAEQQGRDQRGLAAHPIAETAEEGGAEEAGTERDTQTQVARQDAGQRVVGGEEEAAQGEGHQQPVQDRVVPLHRGADGRADGSPDQLPPLQAAGHVAGSGRVRVRHAFPPSAECDVL